MSYSQEQQRTAKEASQEITEREAFLIFFRKYIKAWSDLGKSAGFTIEDVQAYATLFAWINFGKLSEQLGDEEGALISSIIVWMYWNTNYSPEFTAALKKKTNYMLKNSL